jgi:hypothetical protein
MNYIGYDDLKHSNFIQFSFGSSKYCGMHHWKLVSCCTKLKHVSSVAQYLNIQLFSLIVSPFFETEYLFFFIRIWHIITTGALPFMTAPTLGRFHEPALIMRCFSKFGTLLLTAAKIGRGIAHTRLAAVIGKQDQVPQVKDVIAKLTLLLLIHNRWCVFQLSRQQTCDRAILKTVKPVVVALTAAVKEPLAAFRCVVKVELGLQGPASANVDCEATARFGHGHW